MILLCILNVCACCVDFYPARWLKPTDHHVCNFTAALPHPPMYPRALGACDTLGLFCFFTGPVKGDISDG